MSRGKPKTCLVRVSAFSTQLTSLLSKNNIHIQVGRRSRQVTQRDFHNFDYILATDSEVCPLEKEAKSRWLIDVTDARPSEP